MYSKQAKQIVVVMINGLQIVHSSEHYYEMAENPHKFSFYYKACTQSLREKNLVLENKYWINQNNIPNIRKAKYLLIKIVALLQIKKYYFILFMIYLYAKKKCCSFSIVKKFIKSYLIHLSR